MRLAHAQSLEEFGTRSLVVHGIMVITFANAVLAGLFVGGEIGLVSFVALLNLTAGLWIAHSIHSLGNVGPDAEYRGVINELFETSEGHEDGFDTGRFGRLLALIAAVTAIALLTSAQVLSGAIFSIAVVAVGAVAVVTAIVGFLIALGAAYDDAERATLASAPDDRNADSRPVADR
ncbi:hypothetical protein [Natrialba swarupiae]|uniref:Uncharacterized protein n=1 Tax=Natrialba swarupiae TaxID=2448032 RepID=A0A5D5AKR8_9EURY|nr:hypothetical protein [Natrialba swarupiae]TYT62296.1 hypothetical protein FYC77_08705 [Natrialba swarupiae]